jgi:hypothetical protein
LFATKFNGAWKPGKPTTVNRATNMSYFIAKERERSESSIYYALESAFRPSREQAIKPPPTFPFL